MYDRSALHVGQKRVCRLYSFLLCCAQIALFLFSNVNNGHYHRLHLYYVMRTLSFYTDPLTM